MIYVASWNIAGTESFRWSAGLSPKGFGLNLQTDPKHFRYTKLAPPGRVFIQPDLSQAEARLVAYFARCRGLIDLFNDPTRNVHKENGLRIFGHEVEKDSPEYTLAKSVVHASNYREGPYRFAQQTGLSRSFAKSLLEKYHSLYPEIRQWHESIKEEILNTGTLESPLGRKRTFYEAIACRNITGKITDQQWKEAISWKPQATVPDITNGALLQISRDMPDVWLHHQGHDSFVVSCRVQDLQDLYPRILDTMRRPLIINGMQLVIPVDGAVGENWGDLGKPPKNRRENILKGIYGPLLKELYEANVTH